MINYTYAGTLMLLQSGTCAKKILTNKNVFTVLRVLIMLTYESYL